MGHAAAQRAPLTRALGAIAMRNSLLLTTLVLLHACSNDDNGATVIARSSETTVMIKVEEVRTYDERRSYLDQEYGVVEELPVLAVVASGMDTTVPYKYRLQDGREFTIPIVFNASNERIVDPEFDLYSLPE